MNRGNCLNYQMPNTTTATSIQGFRRMATICQNSSSVARRQPGRIVGWITRIGPQEWQSATIATEAMMTTIPHRELRNNSSKILERVKNGETIDVTNNGEIAATLIPPSASPFERLLQSGGVRRAAESPVDFRLVPRIKSEMGTPDILADLRGDR
ncbi:type II toxin-antitoxin system Phd/YefM family antitoxin [Arthrobacter sp. MMS18-M83]|uniref:type II toxin-antitoxin system Phd/YefM family antitoxin n=1 Tax=Arthrobacter sp. MMS18-M83 TaxID=2996261 RepID=UPI00227D1FC0|nr:type II toxin-antitoxin system prevent-host-death family antitoxin [Arthrobacter sp. MMS18-M83]WAH98834.1 type II toxin-antitoxin system prevent-host-death family antitoxin [Arthrobacter sp. MMS18-M83]